MYGSDLRPLDRPLARTLAETLTGTVAGALVAAAALLACAPAGPAASTEASAGEVDRGPTVLHYEGDANGLWWDDAEQALYLADDNNNRILRWSDADGFSALATLPEVDPSGAGLGQLVRLDDGAFAVARFGDGTFGGIVVVDAGGATTEVPDLDPERRRIGLAVGPDGRLFEAWYLRIGMERIGGVSEVHREGGEVDLVTGLGKPVGVLVVDDALVISDSDLGQLLRAPLADPSALEVIASADEVDLLALGPAGAYFTGGAGGQLLEVAADGSTSIFHAGFDEVRGVAYDGTHGRLFVADHDQDEADGVRHLLHVLPVE
ncbi:MAG: hypothetical protein R3B09_07400 [Nannocystaceae bacterium]